MIYTGQIINPVRSARLNTKGKKTIKYERVEVLGVYALGRLALAGYLDDA